MDIVKDSKAAPLAIGDAVLIHGKIDGFVNGGIEISIDGTDPVRKYWFETGHIEKLAEVTPAPVPAAPVVEELTPAFLEAVAYVKSKGYGDDKAEEIVKEYGAHYILTTKGTTADPVKKAA